MARAADLMSAPVHSVDPQTAIAAVHALLIRTRHGAVPVAKGDRLLGLALAADIDRAEAHGLGDRPVGEIMDESPPTVPLDAALQVVIQGLAPPGPGRVLVVDQGSLVGYISRSDLLRYLESHPPESSSPSGIRTQRPATGAFDVSATLESRWDPERLQLLRSIGRLADSQPLYLVGGAVRDLLLGRPSYDLDLLVVGDGIALARHLAERLGGRVTVHEPFGTATWELAAGHRIDVATARAERYDRPAALPDIRPAALIADLERRDFTVNALAMRIDPASWGQVVDPFGGYGHLEARELCILHRLSFIEDPARIVRAIRFERQLGFHLGPPAERSARYGLSTGKLDGIGGERLKLELKKLLTLPGVDESVARLADLGGLRLLAGELAKSKPPMLPLASLEAFVLRASSLGRPPGTSFARGSVRDDGIAMILHPGDLRFRATLALLLLELDNAARTAALANLHVAGQDEQAIWAAIRQWPQLSERLPALEGRPPSVVFEALRHVPVDALAMAVALSTNPTATSDIVVAHLQARHLRLCGVDGHWLQANGVKPGPLLGQVLAQTLEAVLDGKIAGPEAERTFALNLARELSRILL